MAVKFAGDRLSIDELHRFSNKPVTINQTLYWNFISLWNNIQGGIAAGKLLNPAGVGVDTWGVDFGLLDKQGNLIGNPVHYRDRRTNDMLEHVFKIVPRDDVFAQTGIQFMQFNTLYQLASMVASDSPYLDIAETLLLSPDLINYWLTGEKVSEFSIATTTQMVNPRSRSWVTEMLDKLGLPTHILPDIVPSGTQLGTYEGIRVIAPACHDTGSAVVAVPTTTKNFGYISSGTWSLAGIEGDAPIITPEVQAANITNEGGVFGTIRLLKNVMGLWIMQQCRSTWQASGMEYSYPDLVTLAEAAAPLRSIINPNDESFFAFGDLPSRIAAYCNTHHQPMPQSPGEIIRCVLESLALAYREVFETLEAISGRNVEVIHIIGGGSQNALLNQMTAEATGKRVMAGPVEATVMGNAVMQLITLGELGTLADARQIIAGLEGLTRYEPHHTEPWQAAYERYKTLLK